MIYELERVSSLQHARELMEKGFRLHTYVCDKETNDETFVMERQVSPVMHLAEQVADALNKDAPAKPGKFDTEAFITNYLNEIEVKPEFDFRDSHELMRYFRNLVQSAMRTIADAQKAADKALIDHEKHNAQTFEKMHAQAVYVLRHVKKFDESKTVLPPEIREALKKIMEVAQV